MTRGYGLNVSLSVLLLAWLLLAATGCDDGKPPTSPSPSNRVVEATVVPAGGPLTSPDGVLAFSVSVECANASVIGVTINRDDGQMDYLGIFLPCQAHVSEFHGSSADFYASVRRLGQGGHQVSLKVVIATDEQSARAGTILFRSAALATWQIP